MTLVPVPLGPFPSSAPSHPVQRTDDRGTQKTGGRAYAVAAATTGRDTLKHAAGARARPGSYPVALSLVVEIPRGVPDLPFGASIVPMRRVMGDTIVRHRPVTRTWTYTIQIRYPDLLILITALRTLQEVYDSPLHVGFTYVRVSLSNILTLDKFVLIRAGIYSEKTRITDRLNRGESYYLVAPFMSVYYLFEEISEMLFGNYTSSCERNILRNKVFSFANENLEKVISSEVKKGSEIKRQCIALHKAVSANCFDGFNEKVLLVWNTAIACNLDISPNCFYGLINVRYFHRLSYLITGMEKTFCSIRDKMREKPDPFIHSPLSETRGDLAGKCADQLERMLREAADLTFQLLRTNPDTLGDAEKFQNSNLKEVPFDQIPVLLAKALRKAPPSEV